MIAKNKRLRFSHLALQGSEWHLLARNASEFIVQSVSLWGSVTTVGVSTYYSCEEMLSKNMRLRFSRRIFYCHSESCCAKLSFRDSHVAIAPQNDIKRNKYVAPQNDIKAYCHIEPCPCYARDSHAFAQNDRAWISRNFSFAQ